MTRRRSHRILALLPAAAIAAALTVSLGPAPSAHADGWVDGGDEFPCLDDVTCLWIEDCELDENQRPVYPNHNGTTSYKPGTYSYKDDKPKPTPTPSPTPTPTPGGGTGGGSTGSTGGGSTGGTSGGSAGGGSSTGSTGSSGAGALDPSATPSEQVAPGAPSALAAPTLKVAGDTVTVSWVASPNADIEQVTGYLVRFTGQAAIEVGPTTFSHVFKKVSPGSYRAAVWARNAAGESPGSPPSEPVVVGDDPATVQGTLTVTGEVKPGASVTVSGTGFAPRIEGFALELHSDPVALGQVRTDAQGAFTADVTIPATVPAGEHHVVVLYDGAEVSRSDAITVGDAASDDEEAAAGADTAHTGDAATPVPDHLGLAILAVLAAGGGVSLLWHLARGRRRPRNAALAAHEVVPHVS